MNFKGLYERKIDEKGRFILPSKLKIDQGKGLYLLKKENNLFRYILQGDQFDEQIKFTHPLNTNFSLEDTLKMINNRGVISHLKFKPVNSSLRISLGMENYKLVDQNERNITLYGANSFILVYLGNLESYNQELQKVNLKQN